MSNIPQVAKGMKAVLVDTANSAARKTGFVKRQSKITGPLFAQITVLGWLHNPDATLAALAQSAALQDVSITPQALDQRFTKQAAAFLKEILDAAVSQIVTADPVAIPLLQRFNGVHIQDSSTVALPSVLAEVWTGCGGYNHPADSAAVKLQLRLNFLTGSLWGPSLQDGRSQDKNSPVQSVAMPSRALRLADLGYFSLKVLPDLDAQGVFFLSRLQVQTGVYDEKGKRLDLLRFLTEQSGTKVDMRVRIGSKCQLSVRLLAAIVPEEVANRRRQHLKEEAKHKSQIVSKARLALADWTIMVTNVPEELLSLEEALVLMRVRWQIELLFKLWKQHGKIDEWRSEKPWRILCEFYAKLTAMIIQHWLFLTSIWTYPDRSLVKAAQTVRTYTPLLVAAMASAIGIRIAINLIRICLTVGCQMNHRKKEPNTYQLLTELNMAA